MNHIGSLFASVVALGLCAAPIASAQESPSVGLKQIAAGFVQPTILTELPDRSGRLVVGDQVGVAYLLGKDGQKREKAFLDLRLKLVKLNQGFDERGLLGLAFHPKFADNRRLFVVYSAPLRTGGAAEWDHTLHLSEFKVIPGAEPEVDPASEKVLLALDQPYFNHNGGRIAFGPDGYLYVALGDGGNANDVGRGHSPIGNGQDTTTLMGKILRLDVNQGTPYGIPSDNPFARGGGKPEIYAFGFRNPWGISFDRGGSHELFAADVGQTLYEEVNIVKRGGNYGWFLREGFHGFDPEKPTVSKAGAPTKGANGEPLLDPIVAYKNINGFKQDPEAKGISVTGGYVYRGAALKGLQGKYVFADWSAHWALPKGTLFAATRPAGDGPWKLETINLPAHPKGLAAYVVALGEDDSGELYLLTNDSNALIGAKGKVWKLVAP